MTTTEGEQSLCSLRYIGNNMSEKMGWGYRGCTSWYGTMFPLVLYIGTVNICMNQLVHRFELGDNNGDYPQTVQEGVVEY